MKNKITLLVLSLFIIFGQNCFAQTTGVQPVLNEYLDVKNALVKSDATQVSKSAGELLESIKNVVPSSWNLS
jgi:hypothetical protein